MENSEKRSDSEIQSIDYDIALNHAYKFIKSKGLAQEYKAQLSGSNKEIIENLDSVNEWTGL